MSTEKQADTLHATDGDVERANTIRQSTADKQKDGDLEEQIKEVVEEQRDGLPAPIEIPDGGLTAWFTVFGAWCVLFSTFGMVNAFGVFQDYYVRVFLTNYSPSAIAWIGSIQIFLQFSMGIVAGKLFDAGHFYPMVTFASILYVFSYYMLSLAKPEQYYQVFLAQGVGGGIGVGMLFLPSVGVIAHHFRRKRSFAMGIAVTGSSCGGLVFPIMLNKLIERHGFAQAVRAIAYVSTGTLALALICMRTRLPPRSKMPIGDAPPHPSIKALLMDIKYILAVIYLCLNILGLFTPVFFMQLFSIANGVDQNLAFYTVTILNGGSVLGRALLNLGGDLWGPFNAIAACTVACTVLLGSMIAATNTGGVIAISALYGFFSGAVISLLGPLMASLSNNVGEIGIRMGLAFTFSSFFGLVGTPIAGALLTDRLLWNRPLGFSTGIVGLSLVFLVIARSIIARQKNTWKV